MLPVSVGSSFVSILNRVDFPAPFGPITPTIPPGGNEKLKFSISNLSPIAFCKLLTSITFDPSLGPLGITICAFAIFSLSDWPARSL